jgi:hypothetical protein
MRIYKRDEFFQQHLLWGRKPFLPQGAEQREFFQLIQEG